MLSMVAVVVVVVVVVVVAVAVVGGRLSAAVICTPGRYSTKV